MKPVILHVCSSHTPTDSRSSARIFCCFLKSTILLLIATNVEIIVKNRAFPAIMYYLSDRQILRFYVIFRIIRPSCEG